MNNNEIITRRILLSTPQDVKDFCYAMGSFPRSISIKAKHESFVSDAKSILGMLALNLSEPIQIVFESTDLIDTIKVDNAISKWEV